MYFLPLLILQGKCVHDVLNVTPTFEIRGGDISRHWHRPVSGYDFEGINPETVELGQSELLQ